MQKVAELTIEKRVQVVIIDLAQLQEVFAGFGTVVDFQVDDQVPQGRLKENRHISCPCASVGGRTSCSAV